jgi:sigma-B regulation protein RsbU (phosphoserine phosphatase)
MAAPLFDEGRVLGLLYVDSSNPLHRYNDDYLRLLAMFANIIASRLLNYELLQERQEKQVFEAELRRAANIQQTLLKKTDLEVPGYVAYADQVPCRAVGGDLFEIQRLSDGRIVLVVADVSGKGMGAAMLMSNIIASFRILYYVTEFTLNEVVQLVSRELYRSSGPADFATLFVGVLDPQAHRLEYINAGHNPPILAHQDGTLDHLEPCGYMIGAFPEGTWDLKTAEMRPEDVLFVYTDGVTEAEDESGTQYNDRLEGVVADSRGLIPQEIVGKVFEDINRFVGDAPRTDDITMLSVKRKT